jgi:hypothetical protein
VPTPCTYDYAVIRVVPKVDRGEFVNAGVLLYCSERRSLAAALALDEQRLRALDPDVDLAVVQAHLSAIVAICAGGAEAGPIGALPPAERFDWLTAPRSAIIQCSPVHSGLCDDPAATLQHLLRTLVR